MPATYAPGPRLNVPDYTTGFWACQALNTRYLASNGGRPQDVGGLPVDIPADELGTGWVRTGEKRAFRALLNRVEERQAQRFCGKLAPRTGGFCGNVIPIEFAMAAAGCRFADLGALR